MEKGLGPSHPDLATSLQILANLYHVMGRQMEAEPLYQRSLAVIENVLGAEHPGVSRCLNNLAKNNCAQGRYEEAEPHYERALMIQEQVLGLEHPDLVGLLVTYSDLLRNLGRTDKADTLEAQARAIPAKH